MDVKRANLLWKGTLLLTQTQEKKGEDDTIKEELLKDVEWTW